MEVHSSGVTMALAGALFYLGDVIWSLPDAHAAILVNLRMAIGLVHVGIWAACSRLPALASATLTSQKWAQLCGITIGFMIFALLSAEVSEPFRLVGDWSGRQLALSTAWVIYGSVLMWLGFARRSRAIRIGAMIMLGFTILKVFLYDLSSLEQPYRIISFIVLGVILLVASYVYTKFKDLILDGDRQEAETTVP